MGVKRKTVKPECPRCGREMRHSGFGVWWCKNDDCSFGYTIVRKKAKRVEPADRPRLVTQIKLASKTI